ncbi:MAG: sigma-70 family RNA polymerase sigma factor [Saprospiraceae bacterium]|nr:sigma-70 family RNA polymerase sigma factor [Saprospiraceae bacterium]
MEVAAISGSQAGLQSAEDTVLIKLALEGDQRAYASLLERYRGAIFRLAYQMTGDRTEAEDLTLEAFGKAFHKLSEYSSSFAFSTWLYRIATNNCIDHRRRKKLEVLSIDSELESGEEGSFADKLPWAGLNPEELLIRDQRLSLMRRAIGQLEEKYRLVIKLRYFEELRYEEISRELDLPVGTVKTQLYRAKKKTLEILQKPGAGYHFNFSPP